MAFLETFDGFVCEGDTIAAQVDGYTVTARVVRDDTPDAPDQRQDGFWPTLDPQDAGFIGAGKTDADLKTAKATAKAVMDAWEADEWFYCGIVVCVSRASVTLDDHAASLWGIEANYPDNDNAYLTEVARGLVPEALDAARVALASLCAGCGFADAEAFA
ncbi:hypothetical protein ACFFUB_13840 [Algimonas porphyrae]|uniref:Uncharacterized protein n=1 Tax=Algimonas porphyrae TaxID=1128113 RepID=A0ABQ5UW55_9PROT|nr:hypothetical protein [Algimonas porphyrae]GLQ19503.1 hypothetical protein GCM10007854_04580 [Algimonas porphyrae]